MPRLHINALAIHHRFCTEVTNRNLEILTALEVPKTMSSADFNNNKKILICWHEGGTKYQWPILSKQQWSRKINIENPSCAWRMVMSYRLLFLLADRHDVNSHRNLPLQKFSIIELDNRPKQSRKIESSRPKNSQTYTKCKMINFTKFHKIVIEERRKTWA